LWFVLGHRPFGRYLYATGGGREAARLAGIRTNRLTVLGLITVLLTFAAARPKGEALASS